jgi:hypothetical protein
MAVNLANIIVGAGTLSVAATDVGATRDGVQMSREAEFLDVTADQHKATLKKYLTGEKRFVRSSLLEATLENLKIVWGGTIAAGVLSMALNAEPAEVAISFAGKGANGKTRTYAHSKAVQVGNGEHSYTKDGETVIPAEFEILPDLTQSGKEWGTITDV